MEDILKAALTVLALTLLPLVGHAQGYIRCVGLRTPSEASFAAETLICQKCLQKYADASAFPLQDAADIVQIAAVERMLHKTGEALGEADRAVGRAGLQAAEQEYFRVLDTMPDGRSDHHAVMSRLVTKYVKAMMAAYQGGLSGDTKLMTRLINATRENLRLDLIELRQEEHPDESREMSEMYVTLLQTASGP